jgi:hypothetical protein
MNTYDSTHAITHGAMHYIDFCLTELFALLFYAHCCWRNSAKIAKPLLDSSRVFPQNRHVVGLRSLA